MKIIAQPHHIYLYYIPSYLVFFRPHFQSNSQIEGKKKHLQLSIARNIFLSFSIRMKKDNNRERGNEQREKEKKTHRATE